MLALVPLAAKAGALLAKLSGLGALLPSFGSGRPSRAAVVSGLVWVAVAAGIVAVLWHWQSLTERTALASWRGQQDQAVAGELREEITRRGHASRAADTARHELGVERALRERATIDLEEALRRQREAEQRAAQAEDKLRAAAGGKCPVPKRRAFLGPDVVRGIYR